jgi:hypothetical protein
MRAVLFLSISLEVGKPSAAHINDNAIVIVIIIIRQEKAT